MNIRSRAARLVLVLVTAGLLVFLAGSMTARPLRNRLFGKIVPVLAAAWRAAGKAAGVLRSSAGTAGEDEPTALLVLQAEIETLRRENELFRAALSLREEGEKGVIPAHAAAFLRDGREEVLLLDRGTEVGIGVGDIVIDRGRVFGGTVIEVGRGFSRVILLTSPSRSIEVLLPSAGVRAIARGNNTGELVVDLVPPGAVLKAGDPVLASSRAVGGRGALLVAEIREVREGGENVLTTVKAFHLFNPADGGVLVLLGS